MCSHEVCNAVQARIAKEGPPNISRRGFLRLGGLTAAGLAVASVGGLPSRRIAAHDIAEIVDLSHVFSTNVPTYTLGQVPVRKDQVTVAKDGFYIQEWAFPEHCGTHVDVPAHFIADGQTADDYPVGNLVGTAVVIDISAKAADDADAVVTADDIMAWEAANGEIPEGAIVCMYSGWESRWSDAEAFRNADADGMQHYPGFGADAAEFLVSERAIHGVAVDTLSQDPGNSAAFPVHYSILGAGLIGIENIANLAKIAGKKATIITGLPRWEKGSGGPARVLALVEG